jgi:alkyl hydroperoxide reductase subunit AhpC
VDTVRHGRWTLADRTPRNFTLVVIYRGLHCPICRPYLGELNRLLGEFDQRGVEALALSTDNAQRAVQAVADWKLDALTEGAKRCSSAPSGRPLAAGGFRTVNADVTPERTPR